MALTPDQEKLKEAALAMDGGRPSNEQWFAYKKLCTPAAVSAVLAQLEQAQQGAARYKWLRNRAPDTIASIAWSVPAACLFGAPDQAVDAAMEAKPLPPPPEAA